MADILAIEWDDGGTSDDIEALAADFAALGDATTETGDRMTSALSRVEDSADDAASGASRLGGAMGRLRASVTPLNQGMDLLKKGFEVVKRSAEAFFGATEEGKAQFDALKQSGQRLQAKLFELLIGTDDTGEALERMGQILDDLVAVADAFLTVLRPVADLLRGVFTTALGAASSAMEMFGLTTRNQIGAVDELSAAMDSLGSSVDDALSGTAQAAVADLEDQYFGLAEQTADVLATQAAANAGFAVGSDEMARLRSSFEEAILSGDDWDRSLRQQTWATNTLSGATGRYRIGVDNLEESLGNLSEGSGTAADALRHLEEQYDAALRGLIGLDEETDDVEESTRAHTSSVRVQSVAIAESIGLFRTLAATMDAVTEAGTTLTDLQKARADAEGERVRFILNQSIEAEAALAALPRGFAGLSADMAVTVGDMAQSMVTDAVAVRDAFVSIENGLRDSTIGAAFSGLGEAVASVVQGTQSAQDAAQALFASTLGSAADAAIAQAGMMLFWPGFQGLAAGLLGAGLVAKGVAAAISPKGQQSKGPVSSGAVAPSVVQQNTTTNNTTIVNNQPVATREDLFRSAGGIITGAFRRGHAQVPA